MKYSVAHVNILRVSGGQIRQQADLLALEEPLEIRIGFGPEHQRQEKSLSVTMRTPGHDLELALGFLLSEGVVQSARDVLSIRHCQQVKKEEELGNVVRAELAFDLALNLEKLQRHFYTSSSCGVCGKSSIEAVGLNTCSSLPATHTTIDMGVIHSLPGKLRETQAVFEHTGGLHAAALFNTQGELMMMREDVGRHNALDKLIGAAAERNMLPLHDYLVQLSGRTSFELVQKALIAGVPLLSAVGAPSSLAVQLAASAGMTLIGFNREQRYNIYTAGQRIRQLQDRKPSARSI